MMLEAPYIALLMLLLILVWIVGHSVGARGSRKVSGGSALQQHSQGISFLLNEQPDQAIDSFIRAVEVTPSTLETHLAMGTLMRQRGEVDRAIKVHQNILSRSSLNQKQICQARLELGLDFHKAGLLDRAERLFLELTENPKGDFRQDSLRHLVEIYRDEQEWDKAIRASRQLNKKLLARGSDSHLVEQANFYCELALQNIDNGEPFECRRHLTSALKLNKNSARANIIWGDLEQKFSNHSEALIHYLRVPTQQPELLPEILGRVAECYDELHDQKGKLKQFRRWLAVYPSTNLTLAVAEIIRDELGKEEASRFLSESLEATPSIKGLSSLLDIHIDRTQGELSDRLALVQSVLQSVTSREASHRCSTCGFKATQLHWLCPQCKCWETIKPFQVGKGA